MTDRPRFDAEETTSSYSPPPDNRPRWAVEQGWVPPQPQTPPHWIDPSWDQGLQAPVPAAPHARPRAWSDHRRPTRRLAALGWVASGGTYCLLLSTGHLDPATAPPPGATGRGGNLGPGRPDRHHHRAIGRDAGRRSGEPGRGDHHLAGRCRDDGPFSFPATGIGSGVIYNAVGWILTNRHVVCGADALTVKLLDGSEYTGHESGIDSLTDLAIVKVDGKNLPAAKLGDSSALEPGQLSIAIGSPLGTFTNSVTPGSSAPWVATSWWTTSAATVGRSAAQPDPDRRGHQSRQFGRRTGRLERRRHRHQHRHGR